MTERLRLLGVVTVVLAVGVMLGSAFTEWAGAGAGEANAGPVERVAPPEPWTRVRVEVLNSGGRSGLALQATDYLRQRGVDVVSWGNDAAFTDSTTRVIDRVGDPALATWLSEVLHAPDVRTEPDSTLLVEATIKLGPEWNVPALPDSVVVVQPWWDLRRYFR